MTEPGSKPNICAVFLFNHRYEKNIPVLEEIYAARFSNRHYIMPFSRVAAPNISSVFEAGRNFSGHLAQASRDFIRPEYTHYVVVADDLLLNPALDESNLLDVLGLAADQGYIKDLTAADALRMTWPWASEAAMAFRRGKAGLDVAALLPNPAEAKAKLEAMGIRFPDPGPGGMVQAWRWYQAVGKRARASFLMGLGMRGQPSDYPFVSGDSDFLVIPAGAMQDFVRYAGALAALNIFAEIAVPTALALACQSVRTELALNSHFAAASPAHSSSGLRGVEIWDRLDMERYGALFDGTLPEVLDRFPADWLYVHPVKLSRYA